MEVIFTLDEISEAAKKILVMLKGHRVLAFHGEMGAGKTTFIYALCKALGVADHISSPTFSIINQYQTSQQEIIYHIDLYRLKDEQEAIGAGVEDCLFSGATCLVEWPEKALGIFPLDTLHVNISVINNNTRKLAFEIPCQVKTSATG